MFVRMWSELNPHALLVETELGQTLENTLAVPKQTNKNKNPNKSVVWVSTTTSRYIAKE